MNFIEIHNDNFVLQVHPNKRLGEEEYFMWKQHWLPLAEKVQLDLNTRLMQLDIPLIRYDITLDTQGQPLNYGVVVTHKDQNIILKMSLKRTLSKQEQHDFRNTFSEIITVAESH